MKVNVCESLFTLAYLRAVIASDAYTCSLLLQEAETLSSLLILNYLVFAFTWHEGLTVYR